MQEAAQKTQHIVGWGAHRGVKELQDLGLIVEQDDVFRPAGFMSKVKESCYSLALRGIHDEMSEE